MSPTAAPTKQNLFLFFEENECEFVIGRKLVLLYANRCIVDEDAQFEICGVYELQTSTDKIENTNNPLYKMFAKQRTFKEADDRETISEAMETAYLNETISVDTHFIIGSLFHMNRLMDASKLVKWMSEELKLQELTTIYVTFVSGVRISLHTKAVNKAVNTFSFEGLREQFKYPECSVNDDFEISIRLIQLGGRLTQFIKLFLLPMLTPNELKLMRTKDEKYLQTFSRHCFGFDADVTKIELENFPDTNKRLRFVFCLCSRMSFYLQ